MKGRSVDELLGELEGARRRFAGRRAMLGQLWLGVILGTGTCVFLHGALGVVPEEVIGGWRGFASFTLTFLHGLFLVGLHQASSLWEAAFAAETEAAETVLQAQELDEKDQEGLGPELSRALHRIDRQWRRAQLTAWRSASGAVSEKS